MTQDRTLSIDDPALECPVAPDVVGRLIKADPEGAVFLLEGIPEATRARLAVWLYGRSHTHAIGVRVASTCDGATLRQTAGVVGNALFDLSRRPQVATSQGTRSGGGRISLGGSLRRA